MKNVLAVSLLLISFSSFAEKICVTLKPGNCIQAKKIVCAHVSQVDIEFQNGAELFRLESISTTLGCMQWGLSKAFSKNRLCRLILKEAGVNGSARYVRHSMENGIMETAMGFESIGSIECLVK